MLQVINSECVSHKLTKFSFTTNVYAMELVRGNLTKCIAAYMPNIVEVAIQPENSIGFKGFSKEQLADLDGLKKLERLSLSLSLNEISGDLFPLVLILKEFQCLRYLNMSWCKIGVPDDLRRSTIRYIMGWLSFYMKCENVSIRLHLNYKLHPYLLN